MLAFATGATKNLPGPNARERLRRTCMRRPRACASTATAETLAWAREIVVGLNLCPFAGGALDSGAVRIRTEENVTKESEVRELVAHETELLLASDQRSIETTLVVVPRFAPDDFRRWHALCSQLEEEVEADTTLVDEVMLACFHPWHTWSGIHDRDALHFDKRAPHPVVNILRAATVDEAVKRGETKQIPLRNEKTLTSEGFQGMVRRYQQLKRRGSAECAGSSYDGGTLQESK